MNTKMYLSERLLAQWVEYDRSYDDLLSWPKDMETRVKVTVELASSSIIFAILKHMVTLYAHFVQ